MNTLKSARAAAAFAQEFFAFQQAWCTERSALRKEICDEVRGQVANLLFNSCVFYKVVVNRATKSLTQVPR